MKEFSHIQFYDYTKVLRRLKKDLPTNYHITFSRSESNDKEAEEALKLGFNVAVVFKQQPKKWKGYPVTSGDDTDVRFEDPRSYVIGLTAKGKARKDLSGFVV
jgi:hypothetical protein